MISAKFPYIKRKRRVPGREMAYVEAGEGDPNCSTARKSQLHPIYGAMSFRTCSRSAVVSLQTQSAWVTPKSCRTAAYPIQLSSQVMLPHAGAIAKALEE
jgi:hypothetical protein